MVSYLSDFGFIRFLWGVDGLYIVFEKFVGVLPWGLSL